MSGRKTSPAVRANPDPLRGLVRGLILGVGLVLAACSAETTSTEDDTPEPEDTAAAVTVSDTKELGSAGKTAYVAFHGLGGAGAKEAVTAGHRVFGADGGLFVPAVSDFETPAKSDGRVDAFLDAMKSDEAVLSGYSAGRKPVYRWLAQHLGESKIERVVLFDPSWENWTDAEGKGGGEVVARWLEAGASRRALLLYTQAAYVPAVKNGVSRVPMETFALALRAHPQVRERLTFCFVPVSHAAVPALFEKTLAGDLSACRPDGRAP
jgi:pimeloyl-ACP methyl ester carboxylesterase